MLRNKFFLILIFLFAACVVKAQTYELPLPAEGPYIYYSADKLDYDEDTALLRLLGNVTVVYSDPQAGDNTFYAQNLLVNPKQKTVRSEGRIKVEGPNGTFEGDDLDGDYSAQNFSIKNISAEFPPVRILDAKSAEFKDGKQKYKGARVTCCELEKPHYTVGVGSISLSEKNKLFGTNGVLYIGTLPVLYLPIFWRSLGSDKPFTTYVDFTQSGKTGFGLLTSTVFYPLENLRTTVNLDYYLKSGLGIGGQVMTKNTPTLRGNAEVYAINDKEADENRWGARGGYWWQIKDTSDELNKKGGAIYTSQTQFRAVSDPYFNDTFFRSNPYAFMPDQDISLAVSRQSKTSIMRLSYLQKNEFDRVENEFKIVDKTLPKLEYQLMPFALGKTGIISNMALEVYNKEHEKEGYNQSAHARWTSQKSVKLNPWQTLTPYVMFDETVTFKDSNYNNEDSWVSRAGAGGTLRTALITGDLDLSYAYTKRFTTNAITTDQISDDHGEEQNIIYLQNYWRPSPYYYLRLGTGYSLKNDESNWNFKDRLEPILAEAGINTADNGINLFAQNLYDVVEGNTAFIFNTNFRLKGRSRMSLGMTNYNTDLDKYTFQVRFRVLPFGRSWGFDAGTDFDFESENWNFFSKQLKLYKDFHDASVMFGVEDRNNNLSFAFRINVICGDKGRKAIYTPEDEYWNPWREAGDLRD